MSHNFDCLQLKKLITIRRLKSSINTTSSGHAIWLKPGAMIPGWVKATKPLWILHHHLRGHAAGCFNLLTTRCQIYPKASPGRLATMDAPKSAAVWWDRP